MRRLETFRIVVHGARVSSRVTGCPRRAVQQIAHARHK